MYFGDCPKYKSKFKAVVYIVYMKIETNKINYSNI